MLPRILTHREEKPIWTANATTKQLSLVLQVAHSSEILMISSMHVVCAVDSSLQSTQIVRGFREQSHVAHVMGPVLSLLCVKSR